MYELASDYNDLNKFQLRNPKSEDSRIISSIHSKFLNSE